MRKIIKHQIINSYLMIFVAALLLFFMFFYLEKNNHTHFVFLNKDKELNAQSVHVLKQIGTENPIVFEAYTRSDSAVAKKIKQFFEAYFRVNKNIVLKFIDPIKYPSEVKINGVSMQGELVLKFTHSESEKKINITELSESSIINGIRRLLNQEDKWIVIAEGYGMNSIDDESQQGLSQLLKQLNKLGFRVARMPLNKANNLPDNVKAIILPAPTESLNVELAQWLFTQTQKGVSLWWLSDVDVDSQINLELVFGVLNSGKINFKSNEESSYYSNFVSHPITENFNQPLFIAQAREIIADGYSPLFINYTNKIFAVVKQFESSRVVITGDSDLIRNQYIDTAANKSMVLRIVDWLLYDDERVNLPVKINKNTQLLLSENQLMGFSVFFLIVMPLLFLLMGIKTWMKNHEK